MYTVDGHYLGLHDVTDDVQLCGGTSDYRDAFQRAGTTYKNTCNLNLLGSEINNLSPLLFYELYMIDGLGQLYPIPVSLTSSTGPTGIRDTVCRSAI